MSRSEIIAKLNEIAREVFENDQINLSEDTDTRDIGEWDSLTHLNLINEVEDEFEIKLTVGEISRSMDVKELVGIIEQHIGIAM